MKRRGEEGGGKKREGEGKGKDATNPHSWNNFWQKQLLRMSTQGFFPRVIAIGEFVASLWLLKKPGS